MVNALWSKIIINSTCFSRRNIHKRTRASPDGRVFKQIDDELMTKEQHQALWMCAHTGVPTGTHHYQVKFRRRVASCGRTRNEDCNRYVFSRWGVELSS